MQAERLKAIEKAVAARGAGAFHFPEIYGPDWNELNVGDKVKLGRAFLNLVRARRFPGVSDTATKRAGGRLYLKAR